MITSNKLTDRFIQTKLRLLKRTIKIRGIDCICIRSTNKRYSRVHGVNNIDVSGDNRIDTEQFKIRLIINLNNYDNIDKKSSTIQIIHLPNKLLEVGDVIKYTNELYTFQFKVDVLRYYGERNILYEYELSHLKTVLNDKSR